MKFQEAMAWQRANARKVRRLADLGDELASRLIVAYYALYGEQLNPKLQSEWHKIVEDYVRRDLTIAERKVLQERFGHKIPGELKRLDS